MRYATYDDLDMLQMLDLTVKLKKENEKLREFALDFRHAIFNYGCSACPYEDDHTACPAYAMPMSDGCAVFKEMRKLGIEVE